MSSNVSSEIIDEMMGFRVGVNWMSKILFALCVMCVVSGVVVVASGTNLSGGWVAALFVGMAAGLYGLWGALQRVLASESHVISRFGEDLRARNKRSAAAHVGHKSYRDSQVRAKDFCSKKTWPSRNDAVKEVSEKFHVAPSTVNKWMVKWKKDGFVVSTLRKSRSSAKQK